MHVVACWDRTLLAAYMHLVGGMESPRLTAAGIEPVRCMGRAEPAACPCSFCLALIPLHAPAPSCVQIPESRVTVAEDPRLQVSNMHVFAGKGRVGLQSFKADASAGPGMGGVEGSATPPIRRKLCQGKPSVAAPILRIILILQIMPAAASAQNHGAVNTYRYNNSGNSVAS